MVGAGVCSPSEFWALHPQEIFWLIDAKNARSGKLQPSEVKEMKEIMARGCF